MKRIIIPLALLATSAAYSQVGIGTLTPNASAQLEVVAQDKGILIPRVKLTSTTDATTITSGNVNSLLVFNTETIADITPGYYYWYINKWYRILADGEGRINDTFTLVGNNLVLTDNKGHRVQVDLSALRATETLTILKYEPTNGELSYQDEQGNISRVDLKQVVNNYQTLTTLVYDQLTGLLTYKDEQGNTHPINLTQIIKEKETLTILSFDATTSILTYKDEDGVANNINLSALVPANETLTKVIYHATTGMLEYKDEAGASTLVNLKDAIKDHETLTALTYNSATGALTYKDEDGVSQTYTVGNITNLALNPTTGKITYTDPTGPKEIDLPTEVKRYETLTSINYANGTVTYTPERGNQQTFAISAVAKIEPHPSDKAKLRYTMLDGTQHDVAINETITELKEIKNADNQLTGFSYKDEAGNTVVINLPKTSLEYDKLTGDLKYTPTYGPVQVVNIKAANVPFEPDPAGTPNAITATNVQDAIKQINNKIAAGAAQVGDITGVGTDPIIKVTDGDDAALKDVKLDINDKSIDANKLKPSGNAGQVLKVVDTGAGVKEVQYSTLTNADINSTASIQSTDIDITNNGVTSNQLVGAVLKDITLGIKDDAIVTTKIKDKAVTPNKIDSQGVPKGHVLTAQGNGTVLYEKPTVDADDVTDKKALKTDGKILLNGGNVDVASTLADVTLSIAEGAITSREILNGTIATEDLANNAVTSDKILNNTIKGEDIANKTIGAEKLDPTAGTVGQVLTVKTDPATGEKVVGYETPKVTSANVDDKKALKTDGKITLNGGTTQIPSLLADVELSIAEGAITSREIANNTIQGEDIANKTIPAEKLEPTGAVGQVLTVKNDPVAGGKVVSYETPTVASGDITDKKALKTDGKITLNGATADVASTLADVTLSIAEGAITSKEIKDGEVKTADLANNAVDNTKLADNAVTSSKIQDGEVKTVDLADKAVTPGKLSADPADAGKVATVKNDGTVAYETPKVTSANVDDKKALKTDGKITLNGATADVASTLADVTLSIGANAITSTELADNAVTEGKINNGAVTNNKLGADAVTTDKIANGTIKGEDIANETITANKLVAERTDAGKVATVKNDGTVAYETPKVTSANVDDKKALKTDGKITLNGATADVASTLADVTLSINQNAITGRELADNAVTSAKIQDGEVKTADLANSAVDNTKLADNAVTSAKIQDGEVKEADLAADSVTKDKIKDGSVVAEKLNAGLGNEGKVPVANADGTVTYQNVPAQSLGNKGTITGTGIDVVGGDNSTLKNVQLSIANGAITTEKLAADAVTSDKIKNGEVKTDDLANNAVDNTKLADNAVTSEKIKDGEVKNNDLAADAVTSDKIKNGEVKTDDLADNAVTTQKIQDKAVTANKLGADPTQAGQVPVVQPNGTVAYETPKVSSANVTNKQAITTDGKIVVNNGTNLADAVLVATELKIAQGAITGNELATDAVTSDKIANGTIKGEDIAANTIELSKINTTGATNGQVPTIENGQLVYKTPAAAPTAAAGGGISSTDLVVTDGDNSTFRNVTLAIKDGAVTNGKLAADAVTSDKIKNGEVKTDDLANNAVDNTKLADNAVTSEKIKNGEVKTDDLADNSITKEKIQTDAVTTDKIKDGNVTPEKLSGNIPADKLVTKNLTSNDITVTNGTGATLTDVTLAIKDGAITEGKLAADAVTENKIKDNAVTTDKIKNGNVTEDKLATDAVTTNKIKDASVTPEKLSGNIPADKLVTKNLTSTDITVTNGTGATLTDVTLAIKDGAITEGKLAADAVTENKIKDNAVTTDKIKNGNVTEDKLATDAVTTNKIKDASVTPEKLSGNIPADKLVTKNLTSTDITVTNGTGATLTDVTLAIKDGAITEGKLAADAVTTDKIKNGNVTENKLATDAVTTDKIKNGNVTEDKLATDAVTTNKIKDASVTPEKLSGNIPASKIEGEKLSTDGIIVADVENNKSLLKALTLSIKNESITSEKIKDGTIQTDDIKDKAVTTDKLADNAVTTKKIDDKAVTDAKLADNAVTTDKIKEGNVTPDKLSGNIPADKIQTQNLTVKDGLAITGGTGAVLVATEIGITSVDASKLTGTINNDRLSNIPADKITSGTLSNDRLNNIPADKIQSTAGITSPDASVEIGGNATASVLKDVTLKVGSIAGEKITSGTIHKDRLPGDIPADKVQSTAGITSPDASVEIGGNATASVLKDVTLKVGSIAGEKITSGTIHKDRLPGDIPGSKIETNTIAPDKIQRKTLASADQSIMVNGGANSVLNDVDLSINKVDGSKITDNTITNGKIQNVDASKITSGTIDNNRLSNIPADKIAGANLTLGEGLRFPTGSDGNGVLVKATAIEIGEVNGSKITNNTIDLEKLKATTAENGKVLTVEGGKVVYKDPAPTTTGTGNITSTDITVGGANNALLGNVTLAINNLDGSKIANNTITKEKIASVDGSKIENNTITNDKITSVEADKVTSNKTITGANGIQITGTPAGSVLKDVTIGLNNVDGTKIQDNTIPPAKINSDKTITEGDNIKITGTPAGSVLKDVTIAVEGKDLTLGKALEFKDGTTGQKTVLKETKIDLKVGASIDARETNYTIKVAERKRTGATAEEMLVIDANGDLQKMKFRRQQFYMPSVVLPTQPFAAGTYGTNTTHDQASGFFTINLYDIYKQQFSLPVASSNTSAKLEVFAADALDYFVVYVDDSVIDTANMTLSASGVLKYKVKQNAVESEKTFMNIVFQEKD